MPLRVRRISQSKNVIFFRRCVSIKLDNRAIYAILDSVRVAATLGDLFIVCFCR